MLWRKAVGCGRPGPVARCSGGICLRWGLRLLPTEEAQTGRAGRRDLPDAKKQADCADGLLGRTASVLLIYDILPEDVSGSVPSNLPDNEAVFYSAALPPRIIWRHTPCCCGSAGGTTVMLLLCAFPTASCLSFFCGVHAAVSCIQAANSFYSPTFHGIPQVSGRGCQGAFGSVS